MLSSIRDDLLNKELSIFVVKVNHTIQLEKKTRFDFCTIIFCIFDKLINLTIVRHINNLAERLKDVYKKEDVYQFNYFNSFTSVSIFLYFGFNKK